MRLAIMQPYFLPHLGYFQLLHAAERFVIYDDVTYRKGGFINRNRMLLEGAPRYFTVPLHGASPNKRICDVELGNVAAWRKKFLRSLEHAYGKAPHFEEAYALADRVSGYETTNLADFLAHGLRTVAEHLGLDTELVPTSRVYGNEELRGQERVLDICRREGATCYVNAPGGRKLYRSEDFRARGIDLRFLETDPVEYDQGGTPFVPRLSILDVLMWNPPERVRELVAAYSLAA